jgi:hypothetical protein
MHPTSIFLAAVSIICTTGPVLAQDQQVKSDFNLTVVVPLDVTDLTDDVFGIEIGCLAYSSLLGEDNNIVGAGRVAVLDADRDPLRTEAFKATFADASIYTTFVDHDFNALPVEVLADVNDISDGQLRGWTHGECNLAIYFGDTTEAGNYGGAPADCAATQEREDVARCIFPESESVEQIKFSREGFDLNGQLETLPGVDD